MQAIFSRFLNRQAFFQGSAILAVTTLVSYALGLLRDRIFAQTFGASSQLDAYNAAFTLPDLILNIFVAGALTAAFVPIFSDLRDRAKKETIDDFISSVLNGSLIMVLATAVVVYFFAPVLSQLIIPGHDYETQNLFVELTRILLLSPIIFSFSNTLGNILLVRDRFFWYGLAAALYNVGIIGGTILLAPRYGIHGVAYGAIGGALLHFATRWFGLRHFAFKYLFKIRFDQYYKKFIRIMLPKIIGHPVEQFTFLGFTIIASMISSGSIAILNFARNFQSMPINTIGVTMALASFPLLARAVSSRNATRFDNELKFTAKSILAVTVPATVIIYFFSYWIISFFLGGGAFDDRAIDLTATTLSLFAFSIPTESLSHLLARGFYALKNSFIPVVVSIGSLAVSVATAYYLAKVYGVEGIPVAYFIGSCVKTLLLWVIIRLRVNDLQELS